MKTTAFVLMLSVLVLSHPARSLWAADSIQPVQAAISATVASASAQNVAPEGLLIEYPEARKFGSSFVWAAAITAKPGDWIRAFVLGDVMVVIHRPSNQATVLQLKNGNPLWSTKVGGRLERIIGASRQKEKILINTEGFMRV